MGTEEMTDAIATKRGQDLVEVRAGDAAARLIAAGPAEEIAKRIKNASALEKALLTKLESQRDFSREYKNKFPERAGPGRGNKTDDSSVMGLEEREAWCLSFGFHLRSIQRWCELLAPEKFSEKKNAILKRCWELAELWQAANFSSASVEWYTPARYLEAVREVLGGIDLDPASSQAANAVVGATKFYSDEQNGLEKKWAGRVFMNPPYGKTENNESMAGSFCNKAVEEYESGNVEACIILVNSLHSQAWQAPLYKFPICFVDHRIQFISGDGEKNKNPTFQNIFVYLGTDVGKFYEVFSKFGYVMRELSAA